MPNYIELLNQSKPLHYYLRKIEEPFPWQCSPYYSKELAQKLADWSTGLGHIDNKNGQVHTIGSNMALLVAVVYPFTIDKHRFEVLCKTFSMWVLVDDHVEEKWGDYGRDMATGKKYMDKMARIVSSMDKSTSTWPVRLFERAIVSIPGVYPSYVRAFYRIFNEVFKTVSPVQRKRGVKMLLSYLQKTVTQIIWQGKAESLDLDTYLQYRIDSIAVLPSLFLIEYALEINPSKAEFEHSEFQKLFTHAAWQIVYVNDLFSALKEYNGNINEFNNILGVLIRQHGMTAQEAVDEMCRRIEEHQHEYIRIRDAWYLSGENISNDIKSFVSGLEHWMAGNLHWSRLSKRYHGMHFEGIVTTGTLEWHPDGPIYTPDKISEGNHTGIITR